MRKMLLLPLMVLVSLGLALLVLEWLYRSQLVDTYRPELHTFNPPQVLASHAKPTFLVMGDSFTASRTSYAGILQDTLQEWRVINAAVSGTGVLQALYMAPKRFAQFHPSLFLYQVYVGNDLFDIRYRYCRTKRLTPTGVARARGRPLAHDPSSSISNGSGSTPS